MNAEKEIIEIDKAINQLKLLKATLKKVSVLSEKSSKINPCNSTPNQVNRALSALGSELIYLDRVRQNTWKTIKENEYLEVSLEDKVYYHSEFHTIKN